MSDDEDFERLISQYADVIGAAIHRVCARQYNQLIPDVRQEVHIAMWRQLSAGKKPDRPASYIYKVALTTALAAIRRLNRENEIISEVGVITDRLGPDKLDTDEALDRARKLEEALDSLSERYRRAVKAYLAGFNHTEVAELLEISESAARHAIYRGIEQLNEAMARLRAGENGSTGT